MIHGGNIQDLLEQTLRPISTSIISSNTNSTDNDDSLISIQSAILLSINNGSILSFATNLNLIDSNINNNETSLKMMTLLCKDKWQENENDEPESHYTYKYNNNLVETKLYNYEIENLHTCIARIPKSDLLFLLTADNQFPYGLLSLKMKFLLNNSTSLINYKLTNKLT
ncbi:hypothetical protein C6P45_004584 [Maudiozyma exigua]|uniref:Uncharacterized protein n=1 Tax=Maudiozyma exigua TaxID=34358 RepID=A0A9P7BBM7_MAUEX|nr:hypothetical protein C6P45_004584 [Kazachstania exigua]